MKTLVFGLFLVVSTASPGWAAGLHLSIRGGRVTLDAQDVTVRQILAEWARVGKTRFLNVERLTGGPVTLKLENVPEKQALDIILRAVPGYMALPRQTLVADASIYDSIMVMPTTTAVAAARPATGPAFPGIQPGANLTQLRPMPQPPAFSPGTLPEPQDSADQADDPAIAAAAAAGLVPVPAPAPNPTVMSAPLMAPAGPQSAPEQAAPGTAGAPYNPFNAPAATSTPTFTPPPPPPTPTPTNMPITRPRPPLPDR